MKKNSIKVLIIMGILLVAYFVYINREIYGNDNESIIKVIQRKKYSDNKDIIIVGVEEVDDFKIAGFFTSGYPGVAIFEKNNKNNFCLKSIKWENQIDNSPGSAASFIIDYGIDNKAYIVISNGYEIVTTSLMLNDKYMYSEKMPLNEPSMVIFNIDNNIKGEFAKFEAYDMNGEVVKLKNSN